MPLSTTNIRINPVLFPYCFRIVSVLFPYCFRIVSVSFSYRSPIGKRKTIRKQYGIERNRTEDERMRNGGTRVVNLIII